MPGRRQGRCRRSAADLDEEEDLPDVRAGVGYQGGDARQVTGVCVHHGGIELHSDARAASRAMAVIVFWKCPAMPPDVFALGFGSTGPIPIISPGW